MVFATGCPDEEADAPDAGAVADATVPEDAGVTEVANACARPQGAAVRGDVNGDGVADIGDAIALQNHLFRAGRAPACVQAADFNRDGRIEADDSTYLTTHLVTGGNSPTGYLPNNACEGATTPWEDAPCLPIEWRWSAPVAAGGQRALLTLSLLSPGGDVQGWSNSITATGCTIEHASTEGTVAAEVWDEPPGLRHIGYVATVPVDGGAIGYVLMSFHEAVTIEASSEPAAVMTVTVSSEACGSCALEVTGGLTWSGQPVEHAVVVDGVSYRPATARVELDPCAL